MINSMWCINSKAAVLPYTHQLTQGHLFVFSLNNIIFQLVFCKSVNLRKSLGAQKREVKLKDTSIM